MKTQLGSFITVAMVWAHRCSSNSTPSLGTSICLRCSTKKTKKKKKNVGSDKARIPSFHCTFGPLRLCSQLSYPSKSAKYSLTLLIIFKVPGSDFLWEMLCTSWECFISVLLQDRASPSALLSNVPKLNFPIGGNDDSFMAS